MVFINNTRFFPQNNRFDFLLFLVTSFYCALKIINMAFSESRYSSLKVNKKEFFMILIVKFGNI